MFSDLSAAGISFDKITDQLQADGVEAFSKSYDEIISTTMTKAEQIKQKASVA